MLRTEHQARGLGLLAVIAKLRVWSLPGQKVDGVLETGVLIFRRQSSGAYRLQLKSKATGT